MSSICSCDTKSFTICCSKTSNNSSSTSTLSKVSCSSTTCRCSRCSSTRMNCIWFVVEVISTILRIIFCSHGKNESSWSCHWLNTTNIVCNEIWHCVTNHGNQDRILKSYITSVIGWVFSNHTEITLRGLFFHGLFLVFQKNSSNCFSIWVFNLRHILML